MPPARIRGVAMPPTGMSQARMRRPRLRLAPLPRSYCWDELLLPALAGVGARDPAGHSGARALSASRAKLHDATVHPTASSGACAREELWYINGDVIFGGERMDPHECGDGSLDVARRGKKKKKETSGQEHLAVLKSIFVSFVFIVC